MKKKKDNFDNMPLEKILDFIRHSKVTSSQLELICCAVSHRFTPSQLQDFRHTTLKVTNHDLVTTFNYLYAAVLKYIKFQEIEQKNKKQAKKAKKKQKVNSTIPPVQEPINTTVNTLYENVRATEFSYCNENEICFRGKYYHSTSKDKVMFDHEILSGVTRTFTVKTTNRRFSFCPKEDIINFYKELELSKDALKEQHLKQRLDYYIAQIERSKQKLINFYFWDYRRIYIQIPLDDLIYNESTRTYWKEYDASDFITPSNKTIHIKYNTLLDGIYKDNHFGAVQDLLYQKYKNGFSIQLTKNQIYPDLISTKIAITIPSIFIERLQDKKLQCVARYSKGLFKVSIESRIGTIKCWDKTTLQPSIKPYIISSILNIDGDFALMFYKSFCLMFNEGNAEIEEHIRHIPNYTSNFEYVSEDTMLSPFKPETNDWLWLSNQIQEKKISCAYTFIDKNYVKSKWHYDTSHPECRCYIAIKVIDNLHTYIIMYALDEQKSVYRYLVYTQKIDVAIFAIWSYFSSNLDNKRLNLWDFRLYYRLFGIITMTKHPPLKRKAGFGFVGDDW
jgi:hypothetical protein